MRKIQKNFVSPCHCDEFFGCGLWLRCLLVSIFVFFQIAWSEEEKSGLKEFTNVTVEECVRFALQNNPSLHASQYGLKAADEEIASVKGKYFPDALARSTYRRWETHAFLPEGLTGQSIPSVIGPVNDWLFSLRSNYLVYDSGQRSSELKAAKAQRSATVEDQDQLKLEIAFQVRSAFFELVAAMDQVELAEQRIQRSQEHVRLSEEKKSAGAVPLADVTRARAELANAKLSLVSAQSDMRIAHTILNAAMGRQVNSEIEIQSISESEVPPDEFNPDAELWKNLVDARPDVQAAQRRLEARQSQVGVARSELLPKVRAEGGYGWRDSEFFPSDQDWYVGVTLDVPLFDGGVRQHRVARTKAEVVRDQAQLQQLMLSAQKEIATAHSRLIEAYESIEASKILQSDAAESARLTRERYAAGAGTINDLLDAEFQFSQAEFSTAHARYQYRIAQADWMRVTAKE